MNFGGKSFTITPPGNTWTLFTFPNLTTATTSPVLSFTTADGDGMLDDVSVAASATPEPASPAVIGFGAMGLLARRRRVAEP